MTLLLLFDVLAALFCAGWFVVFSYEALCIDGYIHVIELAIGTGLAFWGRRSRMWASVLGGGLASGSAVGVFQHAYRLKMELNGPWIADDPMGDAIELWNSFFVGAVASGIVCFVGKQLSSVGEPSRG